MLKHLLLSFPGIGAVAIIPFSILYSKGNKVPLYSKQSPLVYSASGVNMNSTSEPSLAPKESIDSPTVTRGGRSTQRQEIYSSHNSSPAPVRSSTQSTDDFVILETVSPKLSSSPQVSTSLSKETASKIADLDQWLSTISPLLKEEGIKNPLTIIARWNHKYFTITKWDPTCKCFRKIDNDYGIWSNSHGLFIIAHKWANEQTKKDLTITDNWQCKDFNDFWYQDWHTYWRLGNWLKTFDTDRNSNKAIASCYKEPVIFLDKSVIVPTFEPTTKRSDPRYMEKSGGREIAWDYNTNSFASSHNKYGGSNNIFSLNNYEDWKKLFGLFP